MTHASSGSERRSEWSASPRSVPPLPWSAGTAIRRGIVAGALAGVALLIVLTVFAVARGLGADYPLRAVAAVFRGNEVLPRTPSRYAPYGVRDALRGLGWALAIAAVAGMIFTAAVLSRARWRGTRLGPVLAAAVLWAMVLFVIDVLLLGQPGSPEVRRYTSFAGVRRLGPWAWAVAHLVYGLSLGTLLLRLPSLRRS